MNIEGLTLRLLTNKLQSELTSAKIYRVFMPDQHSLLLLLRRPHDTCALLADLGGGSPVLYLPERLPENPETPPSFCMLLRKHIEEGRITRISQSGLDRVITLEIDLLGASSKIITKKLIFELAGRNSNIILTQDDVVIDSLRHIGAAQSSYRSILPGKIYVAPPPQTGLDLLEADPQEIVSTANALPAANFLKAFISATTGIGKATAQELLAAADILPQTVKLEPAEERALSSVISGLQQRLQTSGADCPVYALISRTNQVRTLLTLPPRLPGSDVSVREFADINSALSYAVSLQPIQLPQHEQLQRLVSAESAKLRKKLQALEQDLAQAANADSERQLADTLMANLYQLQRGQTEVQLMNIYDGTPVSIRLAPQLSPTENAQTYYKRYNKYKRAQSELRLQLDAAAKQLTYLASLDASLLTATTKTDIEEIRQEMSASGLLKPDGKKRKNASLPKAQPLHLRLSASTELYIGKNNKQNDYVTFTIGGPRDLWFHTKDIPGSHVLLKTTLPEPAEAELELAIQLAAYFSKARDGSSIPVDCVQRRYVKKPSGSKPGFVIFTNQRTYYTTPDLKLLSKYLN